MPFLAAFRQKNFHPRVLEFEVFDEKGTREERGARQAKVHAARREVKGGRQGHLHPLEVEPPGEGPLPGGDGHGTPALTQGLREEVLSKALGEGCVENEMHDEREEEDQGEGAPQEDSP